MLRGDIAFASDARRSLELRNFLKIQSAPHVEGNISESQNVILFRETITVYWENRKEYTYQYGRKYTLLMCCKMITTVTYGARGRAVG